MRDALNATGRPVYFSLCGRWPCGLKVQPAPENGSGKRGGAHISFIIPSPFSSNLFNAIGWNTWYAPVGYSLGNSWRISGQLCDHP
jgi:hypothetical protein